ncbi:NACHT domain protein [Xylariaceae sp. AK1471]|nr:NACHT domain protein [Xylariaceae sp. AK1471]
MPLRQRDPATAVAQRTIQTAFKELEKSVMPADSADFENMTLDDVRKTALDIENQLAARQSLRNMRRLSPLFSGLQYYSKAIETLCNGTPYLPWLWAPISMILKISSDYVEAFEQIIKAYSRIGESLTRFEVLQESFHQNPAFQQTLAIFYADILEFHKEAYKSVRRNAWKLFFLTSWGRFQGRFDNILHDLKRHEEQLDREANAYNIVEAKAMRESLREWRQESLAKVNQEEEEQTTRQLQGICSWLRNNDTDQPVIFDQISSEASRHPGTCSWILSQTTMACWLSNQTNNPFVWLQGNPGCGKSVIASQLVNFLSTQNSIVITYFCTSSYASSTQYDEILKSLLSQMIRNNGQLTAYVYGQYVGKKAASIVVLEQLLQLATTALLDDLGHGRTVHVIIDGVDDIHVEKQGRFLSLMNRISRDSRPNGASCKVLVVSRATHLVRKCLRKKTVVSLSDEKVKLTEAIGKYAEQRLKAHRYKFTELDLQELELVDIARQIARKADGMFLWARLVLDYLTHNMFYSSQEIREAVNTLPRKLAEFYERVLVQMIAKFDGRSVDRLRTIFGWITFAQRPLRRAEFRSALSYSTGNSLIQNLAPSHLFDMCAPLVEEHRDSSLCFIHASVKDYLQTPESVVRIHRDRAYLEHAIASATCLSSGLDVFCPQYPSHDRFTRVLRGLHGFHVFAHEHWVDCVLNALSPSETREDIPRLLSILSEVSEKLLGLSDSPSMQDEIISTSEPRLELLKPFPPLYNIARGVLLTRNQKKAACGNITELRDAMRKITELRDVLDNYQTTLKVCLSIHEFPGISADELAQFQRDYRIVAFTCRFPSCTEGFENDEKRLKHEISHAPPLKCPVPSCQYPAFATEQALGNHKRWCHDSLPDNLRMKSIRKVGHLTVLKPRSETIGGPHPIGSGRSSPNLYEKLFDGFNSTNEPPPSIQLLPSPANFSLQYSNPREWEDGYLIPDDSAWYGIPPALNVNEVANMNSSQLYDNPPPLNLEESSAQKLPTFNEYHERNSLDGPDSDFTSYYTYYNPEDVLQQGPLILPSPNSAYQDIYTEPAFHLQQQPKYLNAVQQQQRMLSPSEEFHLESQKQTASSRQPQHSAQEPKPAIPQQQPQDNNDLNIWDEVDVWEGQPEWPFKKSKSEWKNAVDASTTEITTTEITNAHRPEIVNMYLP